MHHSGSNFSLSFSRLRRRILSNYRAVRLTLLWGLILASVGFLIFVGGPLLRLSKEFLVGPVNVFSVLLPPKDEIKSSDGRTNILILGTGGNGHEGPNLTDTIIVASIKTKFDKDEDVGKSPITLVSVPRDIYIDSLQDKINSAYDKGVQKDAKTGLVLASGVVSQVTGLPIHYTARIDFAGFTDVIDQLGGVDINVEHTLDDYQYPITGKELENCGYDEAAMKAMLASMSAEEAFPCRYEHLHVEAGPTHMNGEAALKFVRSRHAAGDEGTDFARARRQQLLISALKTKIFSSETLFNFQKLENIYNLIKAHVDSDIDPAQANTFFNLALKYRGSPFKSVVLGIDLFDNPPVDERGWILLPKGDNWEQIHQYIKGQLGS